VPFDAQYEEKGNAMNWKRTARWSWLILPFLLLALWPSVAAAQAPLGVRADANAVAYEVTENLKLRPLQGNRRIATAALVGTVNAGTAICPEALVGEGGVCVLTAMASDNINLANGKGPVTGTFSVVVQDVNPVDGAELVILRGTLHGKIDLSPAVLGGMPLGTIQGKWNAKGVNGGPLAGVRAHGTFEGTFRLPFIADLGCLSDGDPSDCVAGYLGAAFSFVAAQFNELSLAMPTVRLELKFE